jgi:hypothetical protein
MRLLAVTLTILSTLGGGAVTALALCTHDQGPIQFQAK